MGRIAEAISAGRRAVAQAEARASSGMAGTVQALLAPGLSDASLARALAAFGRVIGPDAAAVLICDRMPVSLAGAGLPDCGFEHLVAMPDLLSAAPQAPVLAHQVRRLQIILERRGVAQCHWTGDEAADLVRMLLQRRAERRSEAMLAITGANARGLAAPGHETIIRPLQLPD
jgi:hypothetical protein